MNAQILTEISQLIDMRYGTSWTVRRIQEIIKERHVQDNGFDSAKIKSMSRVFDIIKHDLSPNILYPTCLLDASTCGRFDKHNRAQDCICTDGYVFKRDGQTFANRVLHGNRVGSVPSCNDFCRTQMAQRDECNDVYCQYNHIRYRYFQKNLGPKRKSKHKTLASAIYAVKRGKPGLK